MKNVKLPRRLKKQLKSAIVKLYPDWKPKEVRINSTSRQARYLNHSKIALNGVAVSGFSLGIIN